jgi:hypothetical protein
MPPADNGKRHSGWHICRAMHRQNQIELLGLIFVFNHVPASVQSSCVGIIAQNIISNGLVSLCQLINRNR